MIRCTSVSLLKSRIIHLILVFKKEETEGEKSFTLGDTALVNSAEPGLRSIRFFTRGPGRAWPLSGNCPLGTWREKHLLRGPLSPLPLLLADQLCPPPLGRPGRPDTRVKERTQSWHKDLRPDTKTHRKLQEKKHSVSTLPIDLLWVSFW